jgi:urease accessory protein
MTAPAVNAAGGRWHGRLELRLEPERAGHGPRTVLARKRQFGPLTVQRAFYPEGPVCHLYLLHPPGGVVGGDLLELDLELTEAAQALVTTPGATKLYRSDGPLAEVRQRLRVDPGATLEWLPQETLWFAGARARADTRIELAPGASFLGWEIHCLGRPASAEAFHHGQADLALSLFRDGRPLLLERLRPDGPASLNAPAGLRGRPVTATLLATGADAAALDRVREILDQTPGPDAGATRLEDLLVVRCLGDQGEPVRRLLTAVWAALRPTLLGRAPCPPRIWST